MSNTANVKRVFMIIKTIIICIPTKVTKIIVHNNLI